MQLTTDLYRENRKDAEEVLNTIPNFDEIIKGDQELLRGPHILRHEAGNVYYLSDQPEY